MTILIVFLYLIGSLVCYLLFRKAFRMDDEFTVSDRIFCFIYAITSWVGAIAGAIVCLASWSGDCDKPAKW